MGMITDHMEDDRCDICGKVEPTAAVYIPQIDETAELCGECQPMEDSRL